MTRPLVWSTLTALVLLAACGGEGSKASSPDAGPAAAVPAGDASGLTPFEVAHGIGPIKQEIAAGPVDRALAERGEKIFEEKCSACHKMEERYVGPALGDVTQRRSPTYVMNMMLNPEEMYSRHPEAKKLLAEYMTQMPNQGLTQEDARAVVEHLRHEGKESK